MAEAEIYGIEMCGSWQANSRWRLHGGLMVQELEVLSKLGSADISNTTAFSSADPVYYRLLRSSYDLSKDLKLDVTVRHVAKLERVKVPAFTPMDLVFMVNSVCPRIWLSDVDRG